MSRVVRVLHVTPSYYPTLGGIEEFIRALAAYSRKTGAIEPRICVCSGGQEGLPAMELREGTPVLRLRARGRGPLRWVPDVSALKAQADVIHLHDPHVGALTARFALSSPARPLVLSTHGGFFHTPNYAAIKRLYFGTVTPGLLERVDRVVASSEQDYVMFRRASRRVLRIDNGIDFDRFNAARAPSLAADIPLLYLGRIAANKRIDRLLAAYALLAKRGLSVPLHLVGDDAEGLWPALFAHARSLGIGDDVVFHGRVDDAEVLAILARSRFLLSASEYEGFGLSVVEAMAAGVIPAVSDIPAFRSFVQDGVNGALIDFSDPPTAADRLAALLRERDDALEAMRHHATEAARTYSWSERVYRFLEVYRELADGPAERAAVHRAGGAR